MSVSLSRRSLLAITAAAAGGRLAGQRRTPANILVIMADQHSPHVLGCYGDTVIRTPNLDALARRGTLFRNAYCQAPLCVPSRMSFLTSRQPSENGVWMNSDTLASDMPTFAHSLGAAGYECALIGRMHFNGPDQRHGFTKRLVGDLTPAYPDVPIPLPPSIRPGATNSSLASVTIAGPGSTAYRVFDEDVTKSAVEYIHATARSDKPFCAVAGFVLPHSPFICSEEDWNYYYDRVSIPHVPAGYLEGLHPAVKAWRKAREI